MAMTRECAKITKNNLFLPNSVEKSKNYPKRSSAVIYRSISAASQYQDPSINTLKTRFWKAPRNKNDLPHQVRIDELGAVEMIRRPATRAGCVGLLRECDVFRVAGLVCLPRASALPAAVGHSKHPR